MARKSVTKSKPATKQLVKKYQFAGANSSTYQQVANPYYISGTFAEQAGQEADRYYGDITRFGDYAQAQNISAEVARKEEQARKEQALKEYQAQSKAANQAENQQAATDALSSGTDLAKTYFKQRAAQKAIEQAATNTVANAAMQAGQAGVWAPVASAATPTAASVGMNTLPTMGAAYVPAASTATTAGTSLLPGAVEVGSQVGQAAAGTAAGTGATAGAAAGAGTAAGSTAGTAAGTGASAAGTGASIGAGLATAGIGLGLNIGGTLLEKSGDDNDPTTFTAREKDRNLIGSAMKSAGTGVGVGAAIGSFVPIPGVGTVVGGAIGGLVGGGIGLIKGIKENKESKKIAEEYRQEQERIEKERAEAERKRLAELNKQGNLLAQRYNTAFVNSRLTGMQTGFGYNTSTNMNMQPTSSFYAKTGGSLPGGHVVPIGDDAVKFIGRKHSEGGIKLDPQTEVEGGETMDKVMMNGGKPNDYFFSAYLKLGGKSFAKRHEELVKAGASQKEIQDLAKKQEAVANKKGEKDRGPEQIARYGGIHKYQTAGFEKPNRNLPEGYEWRQVTIDGKQEWSAEPIQPASIGAKVEGRDAPEGTQWNMGKMPDGSSVLVNTPKEQTNKFKVNGPYLGSVAPQRTPSRRPGPDSTAAEQVDSKSANTPAKSANAQSNSNAKNVTVRDQNKANAKAPSNQQSVAYGSKGGTTSAGQNAANTAAAAATGSTATSTSASNTPVTGTATFPEGRRAINKDEYGESTSMKGVPKGQHAGSKFYGKVTDQQYADMVAANPWYDFSNFDPTKKDYKNPDGSYGSSDVVKFQKAYNEHVRTGEKLKEDGKLGEQTATSRIHVADVKNIPSKGLDTNFKKPELVLKDTGLPKADKAAEEESKVADLKKGVNGSLLAGLGQLIPVGYALARPYKAEGNLPRMAGGGNVGAGSVRGAILPRVNMNAERAAAERNTVAVKNAIQNTNAGPGGIAAMMAANASQNNQMLSIANQEQEANKQLAAEEARLGQQASMSNAEMAQRANMANVQNRLAVNQANLEAGIQEARLKIDEKRYKREEILGALDTAASRIAGIVKDEKSYKAQERLAKAIDNTGSYDRFTIYEQLQKESQKKGSPYYGKTDVELKKIASDTYNEVLGKMGMEAEQKTGGARRYTSRLGDLNRGRNKRNFNI